MRASFGAELLVLRKWPAVWVIALLPPSMVALFDYFFLYFEAAAEGGGFGPLLPGDLLPTVLGGLALYGGAAATVLGALVSGGEHGRGTLKTALSQRPGRAATYAGQALAILAVLAASVLVSLAVGALCSAAVSAAAGEGAPWPGPAEVALGFAAALLVCAAYAAVGQALGVLLRGAGPAIGAGLVWAFVVQVSVETVAVGSTGPIRAVYLALPGTNATALVNAVGGGAGMTMASPALAPWVLAAYAAASLALGAYLLTRRDAA